MKDRDRTTQQLIAENEVLRRRLEELEDRVQRGPIATMLLQAVSVGVHTCDCEGRITFANSALCRLLAVAKPEDVVGTPAADLLRKGNQQRWRNEIAPEVHRTGEWHGELTIQVLDGRRFATLQTIWLLRETHSERHFLAAVVIDVSEQKRADEALRRTEQRLQLAFNAATDAM